MGLIYLSSLIYFLFDNISWIMYDVNMKDIDTNKIEELVGRVKAAEHKTDFIVSWFAKK